MRMKKTSQTEPILSSLARKLGQVAGSVVKATQDMITEGPAEIVSTLTPSLAARRTSQKKHRSRVRPKREVSARRVAALKAATSTGRVAKKSGTRRGKTEKTR